MSRFVPGWTSLAWRTTCWTAALIACLTASVAGACEAGICVEQIAPDDGDEVPLNAEFWVFFDNVAGFGIDATLLDSQGQEVPTTAEVVELGPKETLVQTLLHLVPDQDLAPSSAYSLVVEPEEDLCTGSVDIEKTFTTTDGADETAPVLDGAVDLSATFVADLSAGSNCTLGPPRFRYTVELMPSPDAVAYRLYLDGALVALAPAGPRVEGGGVPRPENTVTYDEMTDDGGTAPDRCFVLRAVDLAGNESAAVDVECLEDPTGDDDSAAGGDDEAGDCACRQTSSGFRGRGAGLFVWALVALLAALRLRGSLCR